MNQDQNQNPYDFIMNTGKQAQSPLPLPIHVPDTSTKKGRIILVCIVSLLAIIVLSLGYSFISNAGKADIAGLTSLASRQAEIIRISKLTKDKSQDIKTSSLAASVQTIVLSDQQALLKTIRSHGKKLTDKELSALKSSKTDAALENALKNNRFDEEFLTTIKNQLLVYQQTLKTSYDKAKSANERTVLKNAYDHVQLVLEAPTALK